VNQQPSEQDSSHHQPHASPVPSDCRMVDDVIEEYALGILEPARQVAIERHLVRCSACASLVASFQQTAAVLALAVPLATPAASARTALRARIADTSRVAALPSGLYAGSLADLRTPALPASNAVQVPMPAPATTQQSWWRVYAAPLATLPLLLALGLVAAWGMNNYVRLNDRNDELAARDLQIALLSSQLSNENSQGMTALLASPSSKRYVLSPEESIPGDDAKGTLFADAQNEQAVLQVSGLSSGTYSVVVQTEDGQMVPKTEFVVGAEGSATALVDLGAQISDLQSVHIRPTTSITDTDVAAIDPPPDVLMTTIGPDLLQNSDTSPQGP
jgi:hypothetical protein